MLTHAGSRGSGDYSPIIIGDSYRLRGYLIDAFDYIVDIGANIGMFSLMGMILHPKAKIIAIEADTRTFEYCKNNLGLFGNIECHNIALGNGEKFRCTSNRGSCSTINRFGHDDFITDDNFVQSYTLSAIFDLYNISGRYFLKIDCEGGERYIIGDAKAEDVIRNSIQTSMEVHFEHDNYQFLDGYPKLKTYNEWIFDIFAKDFKITQSDLIQTKKRSDKFHGACHYTLVRL